MMSGINCEVSISTQMGSCFTAFQAAYASIACVAATYVLIRSCLAFRFLKSWNAQVSVGAMCLNMITLVIRSADPMNWSNSIPRVVYKLVVAVSLICIYTFATVRFELLSVHADPLLLFGLFCS